MYLFVFISEYQKKKSMGNADIWRYNGDVRSVEYKLVFTFGSGFVENEMNKCPRP
jgi:hypothetical protein